VPSADVDWAAEIERVLPFLPEQQSTGVMELPSVRLIAALCRYAGRSVLLIVFGWILLSSYWFATAEGRVRKLCGNMHEGMPIAKLDQYASDNGLRSRATRSSGVSFLVESKTFGRHGCKVETAEGVVQKVEQTCAD